MTVVLVDARNVLRSRWPNVPESELVERCRSWAEQQDVRALIVFDGESTWLEGLALVGLYVIIAASVWWGPPISLAP